MDTIRRFLWKHFGITLDRETWIVGSIVACCILGVIGFGTGFVMTRASIFSLLVVLCLAGAGLFIFGGSYNAVTWSFSSKKERAKIEEEIAFKQLRRRARDKHYKP